MIRQRQPSPATLKILTCLAAAPNGLHGYALMQAAGLASGTLYPILKRLSDRRWLEKAWEATEDISGPQRRIYTLTPLGHSQLQTFSATDMVPSSAGPQGDLA